MAEVPSQIGRQRYSEIGQTDAAQLVAVPIDRRNEMSIGFAHCGRQYRCDPSLGLRTEVDCVHARWTRRKAHARYRRKQSSQLFRRDRRAVGETRMAAWRRIFLPRRPPVQPRQRRTKKGAVIDTVELLSTARAV